MALLEQWRTYAEEQQSGPQGPQFWKMCIRDSYKPHTGAPL